MIPTRDASRPFPPVADGALRSGRQVFHRYMLDRVVGRGGMGVVWLARDEKLDRPVALKFLPEVFFLDAAARDDLKRETRRSLELTHPHIVRIHDFVEDEEMAAIAMEYVDGPTLSQLRIEQPSRHFDTESLSTWTAGLCAALEYAHSVGRCVHRDLKPGNLMVSARGVLKVADFGIACNLHNTAARVSAWSSTGGTLGYMSPQQLMGELAAPSDDLYSVGATLYELLTGTLPFFGGDLALQIREVVPETMTERRRKLGLPAPPLVAAWEETIAACLAKQPRDRPKSAAEIARRLALSAAMLCEMSPATGDESPPTISSAPTSVVRHSPWAMLQVRARKVGARAMRHRWPIITAVALCAAVLPWISGSRPAERPPVPEQSIPAETISQSVAPFPTTVASIPTEVTPAPAAVPVPVPPPPLSGDQLALLAPIPAASPAAAEVPAPAEAPQVKIVSVPSGIPFKVLASAYEASIEKVLRTGETPAVLNDLPPGAYRVVFAPPGFATRAASVQVPVTGEALFQQDFPHGTLKVRSQPDGAAIECDGRDVGVTPLEIPVLPGRHELTAESNGRDARPRTVQVADASEQTITFDFRGTAATTKSKPRRLKKAEDDSMLTKVGRSIKTFFSGDKAPKKR